MTLKNKKILLGITGSISAYKAPMLVRSLVQSGAEVRCIMTPAAGHFVTKDALEAIGGKVFSISNQSSIGWDGMIHIDLARWADVVGIVPASADFIARYASGFADSLLHATCIATTKKVFIAPAMNREMWSHVSTQDNIAVLRQRGVDLIGPEDGIQACGEEGFGRMVEPSQVLSFLQRYFSTEKILQDVSIVVTAGPTKEAIDPVRFISNHSSGRMGYAMARAAMESGARVTLISGPSFLTPPPVAQIIKVTSAAEMHETVMDALSGADILIAAAAVSDYTPTSPAKQKMKKHGENLTFNVRLTADIVESARKCFETLCIVGFAAETENLEHNAKTKLREKKMQMIVANLVGEHCGFNQEDNACTLFWGNEQQAFPKQHKDMLANALIKTIAKFYHARN